MGCGRASAAPHSPAGAEPSDHWARPYLLSAEERSARWLVDRTALRCHELGCFTAPGSEQADLAQHGGVIPVDALAGDAVVPELDDNNKVDVHFPVGRCHAGQKPVHLCGVGEGDVELVDELIVAHHPVDRPIWRSAGQDGMNTSR